MDLRFTREQEELRSRVRDLLERKAPLRTAASVAASIDGYSRNLWAELATEGLLRRALSEELGGEGGSFLDACLILAELGRTRTPTPFLTAMAIGGRAIERWGSLAQKREHLPEIAAGRRIVAYGDFEPIGSWSTRSRSLRARPSGEGFLLHGEKSFVPYAAEADLLLVTAVTEREEPPEEGELFLVDARASGITIEALETVDWDRYCRVRFDGVPAEVLPGRSGGAPSDLMEWGAAARCAEMVGGAERVLELSTDHARRREQFGRPIGSFQAVQHRLADMAVDVVSSRLVTFEAVWRISEELPAAREVSIAKAWVGEAYLRICSAGHQVFGALGYTQGHPMHLFLRHAQSGSLQFGDADYHRELLANGLGI